MREWARKEVAKISASAWTFLFCFLAAVTLVIASNIWLYWMLEEVNRRLPKDAQIDGLTIRWKMYKVLRLHAEMYPKSPRRWQMWALPLTGFALMFGGFIASAILNSR